MSQTLTFLGAGAVVGGSDGGAGSICRIVGNQIDDLSATLLQESWEMVVSVGRDAGIQLVHIAAATWHLQCGK